VKTMAEEISLHSQIGRDEKGQYCTGCNHRYGYAAQRGLNLQACEHVAAMLTAAGFGPVKAAAAGALRDAAKVLEFDASNSSYTDPEEVTQGQLNAAEWLCARAATIKADQ
jgi:hypothetical protein